MSTIEADLGALDLKRDTFTVVVDDHLLPEDSKSSSPSYLSGQIDQESMESTFALHGSPSANTIRTFSPLKTAGKKPPDSSSSDAGVGSELEEETGHSLDSLDSLIVFLGTPETQAHNAFIPNTRGFIKRSELLETKAPSLFSSDSVTVDSSFITHPTSQHQENMTSPSTAHQKFLEPISLRNSSSLMEDHQSSDSLNVQPRTPEAAANSEFLPSKRPSSVSIKLVQGIKLSVKQQPNVPTPTSALSNSPNHAPTAARKEATRDQPKPEHSPRALNIQPLKSVQAILVVDDSEVNRKILITVLQSLGNFIIDEAVMGTEAVEKVKYRREPYDVIFMDLTMPVMGGREATQKIKKELGSPSRVIAVTGDSISSKELNLLYQVGFLAVQPKPFTKENIEKFLRF